MDDNCGEWVELRVWLVGVVSRRRVWLVGVGVASGCGCKEVYIDFLILLIPTPLVSVLLQQHPYFFFIFKNVFRSL